MNRPAVDTGVPWRQYPRIMNVVLRPEVFVCRLCVRLVRSCLAGFGRRTVHTDRWSPRYSFAASCIRFETGFMGKAAVAVSKSGTGPILVTEASYAGVLLCRQGRVLKRFGRSGKRRLGRTPCGKIEFFSERTGRVREFCERERYVGASVRCVTDNMDPVPEQKRRFRRKR